MTEIFDITLTDIINRLDTLAADLKTDAHSDWAEEPEKVRSTIQANHVEQAMALLQLVKSQGVNNIR